ncbi:hypothetical protein [Oceanobacillus kapialis]|uniref:Uncharacterized protein n=1 Tax=Oceanobacillus kapialis TaxID=481353 RepID=A0ABW5Q4A1_9BACI
MIKSKKLFYSAVILYVISIVLNFPFPHENPYGETISSIVNIPIETVNGLQVVGVITLVILISSLVLLAMSLNKYHVRSVLIAIVISMSLPMMLVTLYQNTLATGVYAISYDQENSHCEFEMVDESTLHGKCELPFENHRGSVNEFTVEFKESYATDRDVPMETLMNQNAPYEVKLDEHDQETITIEADIDVSNMENYIEDGFTRYVSIVIRSGDQIRKL